MSDKSKIEWTDATWNPVTGCTKVSPGCDHCYAETIANRFTGTKAYPRGFDVTLRPERLDQPLRWHGNLAPWRGGYMARGVTEPVSRDDAIDYLLAAFRVGREVSS